MDQGRMSARLALTKCVDPDGSTLLHTSTMLPGLQFYYKPLATEENEDPLSPRKVRIIRIKKLLFQLLTLFAIGYASYLGTSALLDSGFMRHTHGPGCPHRNFTVLPTNLTLPSGDKIPTVALGKVWVSYQSRSSCEPFECRSMAGR